MAATRFYQWVAHGDVNCPMCERLEGEIKSEDAWTGSIGPGFHKGCDCSLELVDVLNDEDIDEDALDVLAHIARRQRIIFNDLNNTISGNITGGLDPKPAKFRRSNPGSHLPLYENIR